MDMFPSNAQNGNNAVGLKFPFESTKGRVKNKTQRSTRAEDQIGLIFYMIKLKEV